MRSDISGCVANSSDTPPPGLNGLWGHHLLDRLAQDPIRLAGTHLERKRAASRSHKSTLFGDGVVGRLWAQVLAITSTGSSTGPVTPICDAVTCSPMPPRGPHPARCRCSLAVRLPGERTPTVPSVHEWDGG
jgi:hypothetical protein